MRKKCRKIAGLAAAAEGARNDAAVVAVGSQLDNISTVEEEQRAELKVSLILTSFGHSLVHHGLQWGSDTHLVSVFTPTESLELLRQYLVKAAVKKYLTVRFECGRQKV